MLKEIENGWLNNGVRCFCGKSPLWRPDGDEVWDLDAKWWCGECQCWREPGLDADWRNIRPVFVESLQKAGWVSGPEEP